MWNTPDSTIDYDIETEQPQRKKKVASIQKKRSIFDTISSGDHRALLNDLRAGADTNARDESGRTPLHFAIDSQQDRCAKLLVNKGADLNIIDHNGDTPLHLAVRNGNVRLAKFLIYKGARMDIENSAAETPIFIAISNGLLSMVRYLVTRGATLTASAALGLTPLHLALANGAYETAEYLIKHGADLNTPNNEGKTPLHIAGEKGLVKVASSLLSHGALSTLTDAMGRTPITAAIDAGFGEIISPLFTAKPKKRRSYLEKYGEDTSGDAGFSFDDMYQAPDEVDSPANRFSGDNFSIIEDAPAEEIVSSEEFLSGILEKSKSSKTEAISSNDIVSTPATLKEGIENRTLKNNESEKVFVSDSVDTSYIIHKGQSSVTKAIGSIAIKHNPISGKVVSSASVDTSYTIQKGQSSATKSPGSIAIKQTPPTKSDDEFGSVDNALKNVILNRDFPSVVLLHERKGAGINTADKDGNTPLHHAAKVGDMKIINYLLQNRADQHAQNNMGFTPLMMAVEEGLVPVVRHLIDEGALFTTLSSKGDTPLHIAVSNERDEMAEFLVLKGADPYTKNTLGKTPVDIAKHMGLKRFEKSLLPSDERDSLYQRLVEAILEQDYDEVASCITENTLDWSTPDEDGNTLLHIAASLENMDIIEIMLEDGADPLIKNTFGATPIDIALINDNEEAAEFMESYHEHFEPIPEDYKIALFHAAKTGNLNTMKELVANGVEINTRDENYNTPLRTAIYSNNLDLIKYMVTNGADINAINKFGATILHSAAARGSIDIFKYFLTLGLDIHIRDNDGLTPLDAATFNSNEETKEFAAYIRDLGYVPIKSGKSITSAPVIEDAPVKHVPKAGKQKATGHIAPSELHKAIDNQDLDEILKLLDSEVDVNALDKEGNTPLLIAVSKVFPEKIVAMLLNAGADPNLTDEDGNTPLHKCALYGWRKTVKLLLDSGANVNIQNTYGDSPIFQVCSGVFDDILMMFLRNGANVNIKNSNGYTPLHMAAMNNAYSAIKILVDRGAKMNAVNKYGKTPTEMGNFFTKAYMFILEIIAS